MSKDSCARYYQKKKRKNSESLVKGIAILLKKKKTESENIVANDIKIYQKLKNKG